MEAELRSRGLELYKLAPPAWRQPLCRGGTAPSDPAKEAYPGLYQTFLGQEEDLQSESNVKAGFATKSIVQTEAFSAHQMLYDKLHNHSMLPAMANLVSQIMQAKEEAQATIQCVAYYVDVTQLANDSPSYPRPHSFKLPTRAHLNDQKREAWVADLCNPAIPLSRLAKSIAHGYKGEKLLDMLTTRRVPIARAVWYLQAIGANEVVR